MSRPDDDDFYMEDEPVADVVAAFERGAQHLTASPRGQTQTLALPALYPSGARGKTDTLVIPNVLNPEPILGSPTSTARVAA
jgi:hypothetical protein